jgi:hypothetical protein
LRGQRAKGKRQRAKGKGQRANGKGQTAKLEKDSRDQQYLIDFFKEVI